jgi:CheY-like chemotaxis protein
MSKAARQRRVEVLLVEDDPADVELARQALEKCRVLNHVSVVGDGVEALAYLRGEGQYARVPLPDLILLDLRMPRKGGLELLVDLKADPDLRPIPVVIMTTSDSPDDMAKAHAAEANCFLTKPSDLHEYNRVINSVLDFFLTIVKLRPRPAGQ